MLKKTLLSAILFLNVTSAYAFICVNNVTNEWIGSQTDINVPVDSDLISHEAGSINEYADVNEYFYCYNEAPNQYADFLLMQQFSTPLNPSSEFGIQINGVNHFGNLSSETLVLEFPRYDEAHFPLPLKLIMRVKNRPGDGVFVRKGDILLIADMHKYTLLGDDPNPRDHSYFKWIFRAANDVVLTTGTCNINNGEFMIVDMGVLYRSRISPPGSGQSSMGVREVPLTYQCTNPDGSIDTTYSQNIKINLSAIPSPFSNNAVETKVGASAGGGSIIPGLGIEFYHKETNKLLTPNSETSGSFNTAITNGIGQSDTLIVAPVKKVNATVEDVPAGDFNSVATLIMTLP